MILRCINSRSSSSSSNIRYIYSNNNSTIKYIYNTNRILLLSSSSSSSSSSLSSSSSSISKSLLFQRISKSLFPSSITPSFTPSHTTNTNNTEPTTQNINYKIRKKKYECIICDERFTGWNLCLEHLQIQSNAIIHPHNNTDDKHHTVKRLLLTYDGRRGLQIRCKIPTSSKQLVSIKQQVFQTTAPFYPGKLNKKKKNKNNNLTANQPQQMQQTRTFIAWMPLIGLFAFKKIAILTLIKTYGLNRTFDTLRYANDKLQHQYGNTTHQSIKLGIDTIESSIKHINENEGVKILWGWLKELERNSPQFANALLKTWLDAMPATKIFKTFTFAPKDDESPPIPPPSPPPSPTEQEQLNKNTKEADDVIQKCYNLIPELEKYHMILILKDKNDKE